MSHDSAFHRVSWELVLLTGVELCWVAKLEPAFAECDGKDVATQGGQSAEQLHPRRSAIFMRFCLYRASSWTCTDAKFHAAHH